VDAEWMAMIWEPEHPEKVRSRFRAEPVKECVEEDLMG
jgi:hypothetical protein